MAIFQDVLESADGGVVVNLRDGNGVVLTSTGSSLNVNITGGSSTAAVADKTAFIYGTTVFQNFGGVFQDTGPTLSAGTSGAVRLTTNRGMHINLRTAAGVEIGVSGSAVIVDGSAVTQPISAASLPLPTGASTSALQTTGNTSLASIDGKMSPATATLSQVAVTTSTQTLLASNASRKALTFTNETNKLIYIAAAATSTTSAFTVKIQPNSNYESPANRCYTGVFSVIGASGVSGNANVTEYT